MTPGRALPVAAACLGVVPFLSACVVHVDSGGFTERKEQRFATDGQPVVDLDTFDGAIEVMAWDKPEVLVQVEMRASSEALLDDVDVRMTQDGTTVTVKAALKERDGWDLPARSISRSARIVATVPVESIVRLRSADGSLRVEGIRGRVDARTADGRIVMRQVAGDVVADSGDGSVQIEELDGRCVAGTRDGSVLVSGRLRALKATSGDGSVTIRATDGSEVSEDWEIETADGGVLLALPDALDARIDARTNDGRIALSGFPDLPVTRDGDARTLQTVLGAGTHALRIRTADGGISLKRAH